MEIEQRIKDYWTQRSHDFGTVRKNELENEMGQVYAAGAGHSSGRAEQGLRHRRKGKRCPQLRCPVEKRAEILHAHHHHAAGPVHRKSLGRYGDY